MRAVIRMSQDDGRKAIIKEFSELQTITITTDRNVFPVRRLGESHVASYGRGARTIAGSLIFTLFQRDAFAELYRRSIGFGELYSPDSPFLIDQFPEFDIIINATNEMGISSTLIVAGVTLKASGLTLSIDDMYTENTFTYLARYMFPLERTFGELDETSGILYNTPRSASAAAFQIMGDLAGARIEDAR